MINFKENLPERNAKGELNQNSYPALIPNASLLSDV